MDNTVTRIEVHPNGSARWTIQIRTRLDSPERVDEYEAFIARFEANRSRFLETFRTRMRGVVANADNATTRDMRAVEFTASATIQEVPRRWGIVTFQFTWTNFAARSDTGLTVGDVFQGGFFLAANDTLVISAPSGYEIDGAEPAPDNREAGQVSWLGREDFPDQQPRVELRPQAGPGSPTGSPSTGPNQPSLPPIGGVDTTVWLGGVVGLLTLAALGLIVLRRRFRDASGQAQPGTADGKADDAGAEAVMTDEERVTTLLADQGGRVRQSTVADELDWSASKTSRVIGRMVDQGTVEKLQLGRENLLDLVEDEE